MTREEAIKIIDCYDIGFYDLSGEKIPADKLADAFDMAIEALSADTVATIQTGQTYGKSAYIKELAEVVRCKDCRWWKGSQETKHNNHLCKRALDQNIEYWTKADDFCSYGERREE